MLQEMNFAVTNPSRGMLGLYGYGTHPASSTLVFNGCFIGGVGHHEEQTTSMTSPPSSVAGPGIPVPKATKPMMEPTTGSRVKVTEMVSGVIVFRQWFRPV